METPADRHSNPPTHRRLRDRLPSRRECLEVGGIAAVAGFVSSLSPPSPLPAFDGDLSPLVPRLNDLESRLREKTAGWLKDRVEAIARPGKSPAESYVYTVELAQLMEYFALVGEADIYRRLRDFAVTHVVIDKPGEEFTKGFVLWRCVPGTKPDASGTTEALRIARALWAGDKAFNRPEDRSLALTILDGYGRHYTVDQDIWLIRNYFNFGSGAFSNNTFVIDYDADFVRRAADDLKSTDPAAHTRLADLATKSYELMRRTPTPCGLLYDLVQPELKTMYWGIEVAAFSPNDVVQTNNAATTAATIARGEPGIARRVLAFIKEKHAADGKVHSHYYGRTGERVLPRTLGASENLAIAKLAALLDDKPAVQQFVQDGLPRWENFVGSEAAPHHAWAASEMLLGLHEVRKIAGAF